MLLKCGSVTSVSMQHTDPLGGFCRLHHEAVRISNLDHAALDSRMVDERRIGKDLEESGRHLIEVLSWHLPGGTDETTKSLSQDDRCPGRDSNRKSTEHESRALPLCYPLGK
jgi:hypothetical protein